MDEIDYLISILNSKSNNTIETIFMTDKYNQLPIFPEAKFQNIQRIDTKIATKTFISKNFKETEKIEVEGVNNLPNISKIKKVKIIGNYSIEPNNNQITHFKPHSEIESKRRGSLNKICEESNIKLSLSNSIRYLDFRPYIDSLTKLKSIENSQRNTGYYFKIVGSESLLVKCLLEDNGLTEITNHNQDWTIMWSSSSIKKKTYERLKPFQKVNHFPRNSEITRKDLLYKNISKFRTLFPTNKSFSFIPESFILPNEKHFLQEEMEADPNQIWIVKPVSLSQGRGIFVTNNITDIVSEGQFIACKYISNPYLIDGYKFDMRIYVLVTSITPLRIYVYEDGFARFATEKYYLGQPFKASKFMHLTNYAVNKQSKNFIQNTDAFVDGVGSKWSLNALKKYFINNNIAWDEISNKINDIIIKTFISAEENLANAYMNCVEVKNSCFELFGFDILLDSNLNPWLIEVNLSPSIHCDSPLDLKIKGEVMAEIFDIARTVYINLLSGIIPLNLRGKENESMSNPDFSKYYNLSIPSVTDFKVLKETSHLDVMKDFKFSKEIKEHIWETDQEFKRLRKFKRIFPSESSLNYRKFFLTESPINLFLSVRELEKPENKNEISKKLKKQNLINILKKNR